MLRERIMNVSALIISLVATAGVWAGESAAAAARADLANDEALVQELTRHNLDNLLDRYVQDGGGGVTRPGGVDAMIAARTLVADGATLPQTARADLIRRIVGQPESLLSSIEEPARLIRLAGALITYGLERPANIIEYWGENPRAQAEIRPVGELVSKLLDQAATQARQRADRLAEHFGEAPSAQQLKEYSALDSLSANARYTALMADYYRALAYPAGHPKRKQIAASAIASLREFDQPDTQVQPIVRLRIGKLQLAMGDYEAARQTFASLSRPAESIRPQPDVLQRHEGMYFAVVAELLAGRLDAVAQSQRSLARWQAENLPADKSTRDAAETALVLVRYRLERARAARIADTAARAEAESRARDILRTLADAHPEQLGAIFEQLAGSVSPGALISDVDTLSLRALVYQGLVQVAEAESADRKGLERAREAAIECLARRQRESIAPSILDEMAIAVPQIDEKLGSDQRAAGEYLDFVETRAKSEYRQRAMGNALSLIARLQVSDAKSSVAERLLDRALPLAVYQLDRRDLAYDLARRIEGSRAKEAIDLYARVPKSDGRYVVARYARMQCLRAVAGGAKGSEETAKPSDPSLLDAAIEVEGLAGRASDSATDAVEIARYAAMSARGRLIHAELLLPEAPGEVLSILDKFDQLVQGLSDGMDLQAQALQLRVQALMATGKANEAAQALGKFASGQDVDRGFSLIFVVLNRLDADVATARKAQDSGKVRALLEARVALCPPLIHWAISNASGAMRKSAYSYMLFEAESRYELAITLDESTERQRALRQALECYNRLLDREGIALWAQSPAGEAVDLAYGDVTALFGKARILYELHEDAEAAQRFARLLEDRKLGPAQVVSSRNGQILTQDNPQYWEATYKMYASNLRRAESLAPSQRDQLIELTRSGLKRLYIREGKSLGGQAWRAEFRSLMKQLLPDEAADK